MGKESWTGLPEAKVEGESILLSRLREELRLCAEECEKLGVSLRRGFIYKSMRARLKAIEILCDQVAVARDGDARWLPIGRMMAHCHAIAGNWLRNTRSADARNAAVWKFQKLAENLRFLHATANTLETAKTGRLGPILPEPLPGPHRAHRPVQVKAITRGGILIPDGVAAPGAHVLH